MEKDFDVPRLLYFHKADERLLVDLENDLDTQWLLKQNVDKLYFTRFEKYDGKIVSLSLDLKIIKVV